MSAPHAAATDTHPLTGRRRCAVVGDAVVAGEDAPPAPAPVPPRPFERALLALSECLADAALLRERGEARRAEVLYAAAEDFARRSGYLELMQLVWAHEGAAASASAAPPPPTPPAGGS